MAAVWEVGWGAGFEDGEAGAVGVGDAEWGGGEVDGLGWDRERVRVSAVVR